MPRKKLDPAKFSVYQMPVNQLTRDDLEQLCCFLLMAVGLAKEHLADINTILSDGPEVLINEIHAALKDSI